MPQKYKTEGSMRKEIFNVKKPSVGICLINCGMEDCIDGFTCSPHTRDYFLIHCVTKGSGVFVSDGKSYAVGEGEYFLIKPAVEVSYSSPDPENTWSFCWIGFSGDDAERFLAEAGISPDAAVGKADVVRFASAISNCLDCFDNVKRAPTQVRLSACVLDALDSLKPTVKTRANPAGQVERALNFIEFNYMRGITARDVAMQLGIDRTHFFRIFKAKTGHSPEKYIMQYRVDKAAELLEGTDYTVTEIASFVGVSDVYYFSKLFKKVTGQSPTDYRKTHQSGKTL